jgi:hypothetical protein
LDSGSRFPEGLPRRHLAEGVLKFAEQNNGLMPKDLAQSFSVRAPRAAPPFPHRVFEVVCPGLLQEIKDASQTILIREKEAVRTPDGQWMKCYAFADTQVEVHLEPTGQFDAWEQPRLKVIKAPKPPGTILSRDTVGTIVSPGKDASQAREVRLARDELKGVKPPEISK